MYHISNIVLIFDFEQTHDCLVHIEMENIFEEKVGHFMRYVLLNVNKIY